MTPSTVVAVDAIGWARGCSRRGSKQRRNPRDGVSAIVRSEYICPSIKAKDWAALQKDEANPLVNRAVSGLPG